MSPRSLALALALALGLAASPGLAAPTLSGTSVDVEDDNRFFTRAGGTLRDDLSYMGLVPGQPYTLVARLRDVTPGGAADADIGEPVIRSFTPDAAEGDISVELPVAPNRTEFNIDYASVVTLYEGELDSAALAQASPVATLEHDGTPERTVQVHAVQRISVTAADRGDGDRQLDPAGGTIRATVAYENLVEGYHYTIWGQLLSPSGQATGVFASIPEFVPETKNGEVALEFAVPARLAGLKVIPSVGIYHQNRIEILEDGNLTWTPDAPNPVMIASDPDLDDEEKTIRVGTPFEEEEPA